MKEEESQQHLLFFGLTMNTNDLGPVLRGTVMYSRVVQGRENSPRPPGDSGCGGQGEQLVNRFPVGHVLGAKSSRRDKEGAVLPSSDQAATPVCRRDITMLPSPGVYDT